MKDMHGLSLKIHLPISIDIFKNFFFFFEVRVGSACLDQNIVHRKRCLIRSIFEAMPYAISIVGLRIK